MRNSMKLVQCQGCHGNQGEVDVILDDGTGSFEECGYCKGTGRTTRMMNMWIARWAHNKNQGPTEEALYEHEAMMNTILPHP